MTIRLMAAALVAPMALGACSYGSDDDSTAGVSETKTFALAGFDAIEAGAGVEVNLKQGEFAIEAASHGGDLSKLVVDTQGSTLRIGRSSGMITIGKPVRYVVTVTAPTYASIDVSSGADVDGATLNLGEVKLDASSGGTLELSGACTTLTLDVGSGGRIDADDLKCQTAEASASSGGSADIWASAKAVGEASSGGSIDIHGSPPDVSKDQSSGGSVSVN